MTGLLTLRHLAFTGPEAKGAGLSFHDGLNILYGASNTGKSFVVKALRYMLGGSKPLPVIDELAPYDMAWLGLRLADGREITLCRSVKGLGFMLYPGLLTAPGDGGTALSETHDRNTDDSLSMYLLGLLGLAGKEVLKNSEGGTESVGFRHLAPYLFTSEETIISEQSPILSGQHIFATTERNVFKLLLTGMTDPPASKPVPRKVQVAVKAGKLELVDEWIANIDREITDRTPSRGDLIEQSRRLEVSLADLRRDLGHAQERLDALVRERRRTRDERAEMVARVAELDLTLDRFARLDQVYLSDIERLQAVEEGGTLLLAMVGHDCPVCGAGPDAQVHAPHAEQIGRAHGAAAAEIRKIRRDRLDLTSVVQSLAAEAQGLRGRVEALAGDLGALDAEVGKARPAEQDFRERYETFGAERAEVSRLLDLYDRRDRLVVQRSRLDVPPTTTPKDKKVPAGINGIVGDDYATVVQDVLAAWGFPGNPRVGFDLTVQDITLNGKARSANGKGVRALLHAAMKVAVLVYCHERGKPHPGFVVLDTPLLTYREPLRSRHGPLERDEQALRESGIGHRFYGHLAGLERVGQFLIVENSDPPSAVGALAKVQQFSGEPGIGRYGLLPRSPERA